MALVGAVVAAVFGVATIALAAVEVRNFTAAISPTTEEVSETQSYTVTITNNATSTKKIKGAKITIPTGFTSVSSISVGVTALGWTITSSSTEIYVKKAPNTSDVDSGESFTVSFSATAPGSAGSYTWTTRASEKENFDDVNKEFTITSAQPVVIVTEPSGTIIIVKNALPDHAQDFAFTSNIAGNTAFRLMTMRTKRSSTQRR